MEKYFPLMDLSVSEYFKNINLWLAHNTNIIPRRLRVGEFTRTSTDNKLKSLELTLDYEVSAYIDTTYSLYYYQKDSGLKLGLDVMKDYWLGANPDKRIVLCSYMHGLTGDSDDGAAANCNRMWILYVDSASSSLDVTAVSVFDAEEEQKEACKVSDSLVAQPLEPPVISEPAEITAVSKPEENLSE